MLALLFAPLAVAADTPRITIPHVADAAITVDGRLDEPAWATATVVSDFVRWAPSAGGPPPGRTEARLHYDDRKLYIGFVVEDDPALLRASVAPREDVNNDDQVSFSLDPFLDRKSAYAFWINPLGVQQDFRDSVTGDFNLAWDAVWQSKGVLTETGYVVEIALPWKSLPYPRDEVQSWGIMLQRNIARDGTYFAWPALDIQAANVIAQEAELVELRPPVNRLRLEAMPTLTAHQSWSRAEQDGAFAAEKVALDIADPGLDLRYGPSPDLSVEATLNPDFSQIESDPFLMDINIRYALSLDERRPFFLAGYDTFTDPLETLYTRAIVNPSFGAKVSARASGTRLGLLTALDASPEASLVWDRETPGFSADDLEGREALSTVLRVKHDFGTNLQVGGLYAEKDVLDAEDGVPSGLHAWNRVAGADLTATFAERWLVQAEALGSTTARADGVTGEDTGFGHQVMVDLERRGSPGWTGQWKIHEISRGFRAETAYQDRVGYLQLYTSQAWKFEPTDLSAVKPGVSAALTIDPSSEQPPDHWVGAELEGQPNQNTGCYGGAGHQREAYAEQSFGYIHGWAGCWTVASSWISGSLDLAGGGAIDYATAEPARDLSASVGATLRPAPRLQVTGSVGHLSVWGAEEGDLRGRLNLVRLKTNLQFTRPLGLRVIGQWRDDQGLLEESALLTWLWSPGTAAWIGYSETRDADAGLAVQEFSVFAKVSALIRL